RKVDRIVSGWSPTRKLAPNSVRGDESAAVSVLPNGLPWRLPSEGFKLAALEASVVLQASSPCPGKTLHGLLLDAIKDSTDKLFVAATLLGLHFEGHWLCCHRLGQWRVSQALCPQRRFPSPWA